MSKLTFYGGIREIGGNKVHVETPNGTIFLDFGRRMGQASKYYDEFLPIRSKNALRDMIKLNLLPQIDGIYAPHFLDTTILLENPADIGRLPFGPAPDYWKLESVSPYNPVTPAIDGVFISHAHFDHIQDVSFLDPTIPIYCTKETKILAKTITDVSQAKIDQQFYELRRKETIVSKPEHYKTLFPGELDYKNETENPKPDIPDEKTGYTFTHEYTPKKRIFDDTLVGDIKGINYKLIPVDHSVPGSCSIVLELPDDKRVLYTGDFRFNGITGISLDEYVAEAGQPIDYLIIEGTRIDTTDIMSEATIRDEITKDIEDSEGLVLIDFGWKDISRFKIIYEAAEANDRTLVIQPKLAYLLYEFFKSYGDPYVDPREMPNLKVYLKREGGFLYSCVDYNKYKIGYLHSHGRNSAKKDRNIVRIAEKLGIGGEEDNASNSLPEPVPGETYPYKEVLDLAVHHFKNGVKAYEIREEPTKYVLMFSYWNANELFDLIPLDDGGHKTRYICASTSPFNDEMVIDETKFIKWLDTFNVEYASEKNKGGNKVFIRRHISGHASQNELKELITKLNPRKIIPIHTEHPETFEQLFPGKVIDPQYGNKIDL